MRAIQSLLLLVLIASPSFGLEVAGEKGADSACRPFTAHRELRVFKDPSLFIGNLALFMADPKVGWYRLMQENPLRASLRGPISLMILGEPRAFQNFGVIARLYELAEPRLRLTENKNAKPGTSERIVPVQICGDGGLGFVLESDLKRAAQEEEFAGEGLPPSGYPNKVPTWKGETPANTKRGESW